MLLSVIIPTFNRSVLVSRAVQSVLVQSHPASEVIVIDDGSTDDTVFRLKNNFPALTIIHQKNKGVSAARNVGIKNARAEWIAFLDSDDTWLPGKLEKQLTALKKHPDFLVSHTDEIWIRNGRRVNPMNKHRKYGGQIFQRCLPLCVISPSSVLIHRTVFESVGLFDEELPACEDYDMWLRICARYPVLFLEEALITKYGGHEDQLSRQHWGMDRFRIRALKKILDTGFLHREDRQAATATLIEKLEIYINGAIKHGNTESIAGYQALLALHSPARAS